VKFEVEMKLARSQVEWVTENAASARILVALLVTQAWQILYCSVKNAAALSYSNQSVSRSFSQSVHCAHNLRCAQCSFRGRDGFCLCFLGFSFAVKGFVYFVYRSIILPVV
jgi:hypothetical protein